MAKAEVIVLTNCTNRKREPVHPALQARLLPRGTYRSTSQGWWSRVQAAPSSFIAKELYCGRAVTETLKVAESLGAEVAFISAGLGVVPQFERLPAYSLTASEGHPDSIAGRIVEPYDPRLWWEAMTTGQGKSRPLARYIDASRASLVLLAMPTTYLAMVAAELAELSPQVLRRIRILGPRREEEVQEELRSAWLPYDSRLDSPQSGINGTASDFPHRALQHFAQYVLPYHRRGGVASHADNVTKSLAVFKPYVRPRGQTASDQEVISAIKSLWGKHGGRRSSILRELRSIRRVACEQGRFRVLADQVAASLDAAT